MSAKPLVALAAVLGVGCATTPPPAPLVDAAASQRAWAAACQGKDGWDEPGPPFRIYANTYYVGTCGISVLLVTGPRGHVVIDSGTDAGAEIVLANIRALGFDPGDVEAILMSHEHFDHVGGMARLQAATGATVFATAEAAAVLRAGRPGPGDPQAKSGHPDFAPVTGPIATFADEAPQRRAGMVFQPILTPGHTPGATSWRWQSCENAQCRAVVYIDSLNPISSPSYRFSDDPALVTRFREGIAKVAAADCDIVIAPHPGAVSLRQRAAGEAPLVDRGGCRAFAATVTERLDKRLAAEAAGG